MRCFKSCSFSLHLRYCLRCYVGVCGVLEDACFICAVPRCTRSGAGVSANVTDLVTPGGLGEMRLELQGSLYRWRRGRNEASVAASSGNDKVAAVLPSYCAVSLGLASRWLCVRRQRDCYRPLVAWVVTAVEGAWRRVETGVTCLAVRIRGARTRKK